LTSLRAAALRPLLPQAPMRLVALGAAAALGSAPSACGFPDMAASALGEAFSVSRAAGPLYRPPREQRAGLPDQLPSEVGPAAGGDGPHGKLGVALLGAGADDEAHGPTSVPLRSRSTVVLAAALGVGAALTAGIACAIRQDFCACHRGRNPHRDASAFGGTAYGALKRPTSQRAGTAVKKVVSWADLCDGSLAEMNSARQQTRQQATAACTSA